MDPADEIRIAAVKKALEPYLRNQRANEVVITPEKWRGPLQEPEAGVAGYRPQQSADPPYPPTKPPTLTVPKGETVGRAWDVVAERLPDEWHINRLALDKGGWHASAAPATQWAWTIAHKYGLTSRNGAHKYILGEGISAIEALLDLAVQMERWPDDYQFEAPASDRRDAVDDLFKSLFD